MKKYLLIGLSLFVITGCGGSSTDVTPTDVTPTDVTPTDVTPTVQELLSKNSGFSSALEGHADDYAPTIIEFTSALSGIKTTQIRLGSSQGEFVVSCEKGNFVNYYISTENITANNSIHYRIGADATVIDESWNEVSPSYKTLYPNNLNLNLLVKLYQNWDAVFSYTPYASGSGIMDLDLSGLPVLFDKTREQCGWSKTLFPEDNGWGKAIPNNPPRNSIEATFTTDYKPFRTIAWRDKNIDGEVKLLVRVGDYEGEGSCNTSFTITNNFYIKQNDKYVSAVVGSKAKVSCTEPEILVLQGDFDASKEFTLEVYDAHFNALTRMPMSLSAPDGPISTAEFLEYNEQ